MSPALALPTPSMPLPVPNPGGGAPRSYQIRRVGSFEVAPLIFQGVRLFEVAAPALEDPNAFPPVAARIDLIQDNLNEIVPAPSTIATFFRPGPARYDPDTFSVKVQLSNGYWTLVAADERGTAETPLLTVTELDAKYSGVPQEQLARSWADILQNVLGETLRQRAPGTLERQLSGSALIVLIAIILTALIFGARIGLSRLRFKLEEPPATEGTPRAPPEVARQGPLWWRRTLRFALQLLEWLLGWSISVVWAVAIVWALYQIGPTQPFARKLTSALVEVFAIWFVASVASRLGSIAIARVAHVWQTRPFGSPSEAARRQMRATTIKSSLEYGKTALVFIVGGALTLAALGTSTSAVVTLGAAVAFAISFGAQSLVKDFVNGFFILVEDQYAIGDFVTIGDIKGTVDELTLRITQLRAGDGRLVTIPNSQVAVVENWTRNYSRVDYRIAVAFDCDIDRALKVFGDLLESVARDPQWRSSISEPARTLGVESVSSAGAVLLGQIRTPPGMMFELTREINRRMLGAFAKQGIPLGTAVTRSAQ